MPSKSKTSTKQQTAAKARKGSSGAAGGAARSKASARTRTTVKKASAGAGAGRRSVSRLVSEQAEGKKEDVVKAKTASGRAKAAKAGSATKTKRSAKAGAERKTAAAVETRPKKKALTKVNGFSVGDHVVYPAHGVGRITGIDERAIAEQILQMFVVAFEKDKMTLLVPTGKVDSAGMRRLSSRDTMDAAITTLKGRARTRRVMWSRRAQEYEAKLNSGDPVSIAEVVRDLHRNVGQPDQSYSERQMYEAALDRLAREFAAVENTDTEQAATKLEDVLRAA